MKIRLALRIAAGMVAGLAATIALVLLTGNVLVSAIGGTLSYFAARWEW